MKPLPSVYPAAHLSQRATTIHRNSTPTIATEHPPPPTRLHLPMTTPTCHVTGHPHVQGTSSRCTRHSPGPQCTVMVPGRIGKLPTPYIPALLTGRIPLLSPTSDESHAPSHPQRTILPNGLLTGPSATIQLHSTTPPLNCTTTAPQRHPFWLKQPPRTLNYAPALNYAHAAPVDNANHSNGTRSTTGLTKFNTCHLPGAEIRYAPPPSSRHATDLSPSHPTFLPQHHLETQQFDSRHLPCTQ